MKETNFQKIILLFAIILTILFLVKNTSTYLDNQKFLEELIKKEDISNKTKYEIVKKMTSLTYNLIKNETDSKYFLLFCGTPKEIYIRGGACGYKSLFLLSILKELDIESNMLGLTLTKDNYAFKHVVVEAKIDNKLIILDPTYNASYNYSKEELKNQTIFEIYRNKILNDSKIEYPSFYNFTTYSYFNYNIFGPFKNMAIFFKNKFGIIIYQPYFLLRCDLRNIIISFLVLILLLSFFLKWTHPFSQNN